MKSSCRFSISLNIFSPALLEKQRPFSFSNVHSKTGMSSPISFWWIFPPTPSLCRRRMRCSFLNSSPLKNHVKLNIYQNGNQKSCFASLDIQFLNRPVALMCWGGSQGDEYCPQSIHMTPLQNKLQFKMWQCFCYGSIGCNTGHDHTAHSSD